MAFMAGGAVFLLLAFMIFLPVIILSPSKFALSFTLGCLSIMAGFIQLRGWRTQMAHMMTSERLPYSAGARPHGLHACTHNGGEGVAERGACACGHSVLAGPVAAGAGRVTLVKALSTRTALSYGPPPCHRTQATSAR